MSQPGQVKNKKIGDENQRVGGGEKGKLTVEQPSQGIQKINTGARAGSRRLVTNIGVWASRYHTRENRTKGEHKTKRSSVAFQEKVGGRTNTKKRGMRASRENIVNLITPQQMGNTRNQLTDYCWLRGGEITPVQNRRGSGKFSFVQDNPGRFFCVWH